MSTTACKPFLTALLVASFSLSACGAGTSDSTSRAPLETTRSAVDVGSPIVPPDDDEIEAAFTCCRICRQEFWARKSGDETGDYLGCLEILHWSTELDCENYGRGRVNNPARTCHGYVKE